VVIAHVRHDLDEAGRAYFPQWIERAAEVLSRHDGFRHIRMANDTGGSDSRHVLLEFESAELLHAWSASEDHTELLALLEPYRIAPLRSEVLEPGPVMGAAPMAPILDRRSIRRYSADPVSEVDLAALVEAARRAPSGSNTQPWNFVIVRSDEQRALLAEACHRQRWMASAPVLIACVGDIGCRIAEYSGPALDETSGLPELKQVIRDTAIAVEHLVLEATARGLGTCWVAWFTQDEVRPVLGVPDDAFVLAVVAVGYPDEAPALRPRHELNEIVQMERWR